MSLRLVPLAGLLLAARVAGAQTDPKYEFKDPAAEAPPPAPKSIWKANLQLGMVLTHGNAESLGFSGLGNVAWRYGDNELSLLGQGAYVRAGTSTYGKGGPINAHETSAENWLWRLRYDRYFLTKNTVFAAFQMDGNKPAGYIYRLEPQVGYARLFFKSVRQLFKGELGYDFQYERRRLGSMPLTVNYHNLRAFLFYENKFTQYAAFSEGLEVLWAVNRIEAVRVNSITSLSSTLHKSVALKLNYTLRFNNDPPPRPTGLIDSVTGMPLPASEANFQKVDMILEAVLAVTFL